MQHRILVVDDDPMNREIISELIQEDYEVGYAENGMSALEQARDFRPELVLLDIMMPGIDGYETCRRLKEELPFTKVILVSAKAMASERRRGYEAGADDYITKPFDPLEFQAKIRVFVRLGFVEEIARTKSDLLVLLAHETRTPLSHILSCAELLEMGNANPQQSSELPSIILSGAIRLSEIFEKSMELFGIETHLEDPPTESVDFTELVRSEAESATTRHSTPFRWSAESDIEVRADEHQLRRALRILCDYFGDRAETLSTPIEIEGSVQQSQGRWTTEVRILDPSREVPTNCDRLFELLSVEDVDHHNSADLDFDLPICGAIVQRHGGSIRASVPESGGFLCTLRLPMDRPERKRSAA